MRALVSDQPVRLAAVSYLNTRPLIESLVSGWIPGFIVQVDIPSRLPARVESGEADLGLLPAGYLCSHPELVIAPGAGIACRGPVRSILLLTRGDVRNGRLIAATNTSMSSVRLLKLLLEIRYHSGAEVVISSTPDRDLRDGLVDGALLIGDPALQVDPTGFRSYDLGEEWFRETGLPFVFALWAGPDAELVGRAAPDLVRAMQLGRAMIPRIAVEAAAALSLSAGLCEDYLANYIIHDVGESEMEGYSLFRQMVTERRKVTS